MVKTRSRSGAAHGSPELIALDIEAKNVGRKLVTKTQKKDRAKHKPSPSTTRALPTPRAASPMQQPRRRSSDASSQPSTPVDAPQIRLVPAVDSPVAAKAATPDDNAAPPRPSSPYKGVTVPSSPESHSTIITPLSVSSVTASSPSPSSPLESSADHTPATASAVGDEQAPRGASSEMGASMNDGSATGARVFGESKE